MNTIYSELADVLNKIPNGYPRTESGVELKLLAKLFDEEQARMATYMSLEPNTIAELAEISGKQEREAKMLLVSMVKKGLIDLGRDSEKGLVFSLIPFVVGFYERQNGKIDKEFAEYFEQYYHEAFYKAMTVEPSVHRVIPIEKTIPINIDVMPYEKASNYLDEAKSWGVLDCICRVQKKLIGEGCDHPVENCLVFSTKPDAFERTDDIRSLSKDEALQILDEADKAGLVHSTNNAQRDVSYICNCCTCSCGVLRGIAERGKKDSVASSDFLIQIDEDLCSGCEICIDRCQFDALKMDGDVCVIDLNHCYGCGLCITTCASDALTLRHKNEDEVIVPPADDVEWRKIREENRANN